MTKMRTIRDAFAELKQNDPDTAMTLSGLRRLVNTGYIPCVRIGRRILINYDALIEYLNNPAALIKKPNEQYGEIRKIG